MRHEPKHWKDRAHEMRAFADQTEEQTAKAIMLQVANDFDRLAEHADKVGRAKPRP